MQPLVCKLSVYSVIAFNMTVFILRFERVCNAYLERLYEMRFETRWFAFFAFISFSK